MAIIAFLVIGFLVGLLARAITPGTQSMGILRTTALGIGGSFVGAFVHSLLYAHLRWTDVHTTSVLFSIAGAVAVLLLVGAGRRVRA